MTTHTHHTAPTRFVEANGIRFAYRRFGQVGGVPLVFAMHFTGTICSTMPEFPAVRATYRPPIEAMAARAAAFIKTLGLA